MPVKTPTPKPKPAIIDIEIYTRTDMELKGRQEKVIDTPYNIMLYIENRATPAFFFFFVICQILFI